MSYLFKNFQKLFLGVSLLCSSQHTVWFPGNDIIVIEKQHNEYEFISVLRISEGWRWVGECWISQGIKTKH